MANEVIVSKHEAQALVQDELCERKVIGTLITNAGSYMKVADILNSDCFRNGKTKDIYEAVVALDSKGENIDIITVMAELAKRGSNIQPYEIMEISSENVPYEIEGYSYRLKELSLRRKLWYLGQRLINAGVAETDEVTDIQQLATEELNGLFGTIEGTFTLTDALNNLSEIITRNMSHGTATTGTPTGYKRLDRKGGLQPSDLIIIAGETSNGKTALAVAISKNAAEKGEKVAWYSMEMTKEQLAARILSMKSGVPASSILYSGELNPSELQMIDTAKGLLPGDNIFFDDDSTSNIDSILLSIRKMKMKHNISGAVVDYLQILNVNSKNSSSTREQAMGDASRRLKNIAKELGIWVIAVSQLSRNSQDPVPSLSRLRDSGQIAEAADVVALVYRPELYNRTFPEPFTDIPLEEVKGKAMIDVAKGRNIGVFKFIVNFNPLTTYFTDIQEESLYDAPEDMTPVDEEAPF